MAGIRQTEDTNGEPHEKYRFWFIDYTGKRRWGTGTDKPKETLRIAQRLEGEHRLIRLGDRPVPNDRARRRQYEDVVAEYMEWGTAQGGRGGHPWASEHVRSRKRHLKWWGEQLGLKTLSDLLGCLPRVEQALRDLESENPLRKAKKRSRKTLANYAEALAAFCDWCVEREYLQNDPLKRLKRFDTTPQVKRRAMTEGEIERLLKIATPGNRLLYEIALASGLRAGELKRLTVGHLDGEQGGVHLEAAWTKNRKAGFQPIDPSLLARLAEFCKDKKKTEPLIVVTTQPARTLQADLKRAGIAIDSADGMLDFHSLRTTFGTLVVESGANVKEAQTLMRHSTPQLTMNTYARTRNDRLHGLAAAVGDRVSSRETCAIGVQRPELVKHEGSVTDSCDSQLQAVGVGGGGGNRTPVP